MRWPDLVRTAELAFADPSGSLPASEAAAALSKHLPDVGDGDIHQRDLPRSDSSDAKEDGMGGGTVRGGMDSSDEVEESDEGELGEEEVEATHPTGRSATQRPQLRRTSVNRSLLSASSHRANSALLLWLDCGCICIEPSLLSHLFG
eukprot:6212676-Pleurochrysis_carterae.AAC.1